jgi:F-type H+/Na+-transporting ATPase subunit beta
MLIERARKLANYFAQPFFVAEPYTRRPSNHVGVKEALDTCRDILDGRHDDLSVAAFYLVGGVEEIRHRAAACQ